MKVFCDKCKTPIQLVERFDDHLQRLIFVANCHGETERVELHESELAAVDQLDMSGTVAFKQAPQLPASNPWQSAPTDPLDDVRQLAEQIRHDSGAISRELLPPQFGVHPSLFAKLDLLRWNDTFGTRNGGSICVAADPDIAPEQVKPMNQAAERLAASNTPGALGALVGYFKQETDHV